MLRLGVKDLVDTKVSQFAPTLPSKPARLWGCFMKSFLFSVFLYSEESYSSKCERSNAGRLRNSPLSAFPFKAE